MPATGIGRWPGGGVNLHQPNLRAVHSQFAQSFSVLLDFLPRRPFAVDGGKKALDNDRTLAAEIKDVAKKFFQRHIHLVNLIQISLGAAVELYPNFVGICEEFQTLPDLRLIESRSVRY